MSAKRHFCKDCKHGPRTTCGQRPFSVGCYDLRFPHQEAPK